MNIKCLNDSLRHTYLGSFVLDPEDVTGSLSGEQSGAFFQGTGLS